MKSSFPSPSIMDQSGRSLLKGTGILAIVMAVGVGVFWWVAKEPDEPMARMQREHVEETAKKSDESMTHMEHDHGEKTLETPSKITTATTDDMPAHSAAITISPQKQRLIGVKTEPAEVREMIHSIRTVGHVEVDERRIIHVHTKLEGWVQKLYVKFTGEQVQRGQKLFEIYSPELVATQKEYLLALEAVHELGNVEFPEIAENARSLLEVTRQRLVLWDIVQDSIEHLKRTRKVLRTLPLHASGSGYVLAMDVREGMHVTPSMKLYTLADLSNVWVLAAVYESEIPLIHLGQEATLTLSYFPGQTFTGKVTHIYPVLEAVTRTVKVRFEIPNPEWKIKPGMFANVDFKIFHGERLIVPSTAVLDSGTEQLVFVDQGQGRFEPRKVKVGSRTKETYEILKGVDPGEMVVTQGNFLIDSESNLKAAMETMMPDMDMDEGGGEDSSMHAHMGH